DIHTPNTALRALVEAGLVPDPEVGFGDHEVQWVGEVPWRFEAGIQVDDVMLAHRRLDLAFDGLDTIARIEVDGEEVGESRSMHVQTRLDIGQRLTKGIHHVAVELDPAVAWANAQRDRLGTLP